MDSTVKWKTYIRATYRHIIRIIAKPPSDREYWKSELSPLNPFSNPSEPNSNFLVEQISGQTKSNPSTEQIFNRTES